MNDKRSIIKRTENAIDDLFDLWHRRKAVSLVVLAVILIPWLIFLYDRIITLPKLQNQLESKDSKIVSLNERLAEEKRHRDKAEESLERFKLLAERKLPDVPPELLLDEILEKMEKALLRLDEATTRVQLDSGGRQTVQRNISAETRKRFVQQLKDTMAMNVEITSVLGDQESFILAHQIKELFEEVKWPVTGISQAIFSKPVKGLVIRISELPTPKVQSALALLYNEFGYELVAERVDTLPPDKLQIVVGSKS